MIYLFWNQLCRVVFCVSSDYNMVTSLIIKLLPWPLIWLVFNKQFKQNTVMLISSLSLSINYLCLFTPLSPTGNVWIYSIYQPSYNIGTDYCNKTLYLFAFWTTTLVYILLGITFLGGCCMLFCLCLCGRSGNVDDVWLTRPAVTDITNNTVVHFCSFRSAYSSFCPYLI